MFKACDSSLKLMNVYFAYEGYINRERETDRERQTERQRMK